MSKKMGIERRSAILYARVKPSMKKHVQYLAKLEAISESEALDAIILFHLKLMGNMKK